MPLGWNPADFAPGQGGNNTGDILEDGILTISGTIYDAIPTRSFGRVKVVNPSVVFDSKQIYDEENVSFLSHSVNVDAAVTYVRARSASEITSGTGSAGRALRQSRRYFNYEPGRGHLIYITYNLSGAVTDVDKCAGYYDDDDGLFLKLSGSGTPYIVLRKSGSADEEIAQTDWSGDSLNGSGSSGHTLDFSKAQLMFIEFEYLGVGDAQVGWRLDSKDVVAHKFYNANRKTQVYMRTPNLPVRWEMQNRAAIITPAIMDSMCCTIISEGGSIGGFDRSQSTGYPGNTMTQNAGTIEPLISFRLKDSHNRATVIPKEVYAIATSNADYRWILSINPVVTAGAAASWQTIKDSYLEYDITRDGTISAGADEGIVLASGFVSKKVNTASNSFSSFLTIASDFAGTSDLLVISIQKLANPNETFFGGLSWTEIP